MQRHYIVKMIGNVSDWLSYAGEALMKVADSVDSTFDTLFRLFYMQNICFYIHVLRNRIFMYANNNSAYPSAYRRSRFSTYLVLSR